MDRRQMIGLGLLGAGVLASRAGAQPGRAGSAPLDSGEVITLWPGIPPGGPVPNLTPVVTDRSPTPELYRMRSISGIQSPELHVHRPVKPNGMALLVIPGGGYLNEGIERGGTELTTRFTEDGVTCFILRYRLPGEGWANRADVPLQDAQRSMRLIRAKAATYGLDPARVAVVGCSAGGHLAASLATRWDARVYAPVDAADTLDARPMAACLMYPVITMGRGAHGGSRDRLLGTSPTAAQIDAYSCERHVRADGTPSFICTAMDDNVVPPGENSLAMFTALHAAGVNTELHAFQQGGHGFSIRGAMGKPCAAWPDLFLTWAATQGFTPRQV